ncbi:MAG: tRNA threonylcarbamoyladenosine biosynthesis protein TsaB, partial [Chloroflexota bacterium]
LVGVSTLDVIAYQHRQAPSPLCAVVGAGRGRCYAGFYERRRGRLWLPRDYAVLTIDELAGNLADLERPAYVCGELDTDLVMTLRERLGERARIASPASTIRRPAYLAELALDRLVHDGAADPTTLQPLYLRRTR